ncbi:MAG: transcription termination/antitermination NusG family protein [Pseudomonadota bacterium]
MPPELSSAHEPEPKAFGDMRWHLTRCWSGAETQVSEWLQSLGFETFVPMMIERVNVSKGQGKAERIEKPPRPAIPSYVPVRLLSEQIYLLSLSPALRPRWRWSALAGGTERKPKAVYLADADVAKLKRLDQTGAFNIDAPEEPEKPRPVKGNQVRLKIGATPFSAVPVLDVIGDRAIVGIKILGREMTVPLDELEVEGA